MLGNYMQQGIGCRQKVLGLLCPLTSYTPRAGPRAQTATPSSHVCHSCFIREENQGPEHSQDSVARK